MANFLENYGLEFLEDGDSIVGFLGYVAQEGKAKVGYYGDPYIYRLMGNLEVWLKTEKRDEGELQVSGFDTHCAGNCVWRMVYSGIDITPEETSRLERALVFNGTEEHAGLIPIDVISADVLPSFLENDVMEMQVVALPLNIDYYENDGSATDKLRTFYSQGRVFYNRGEIEDAMECLIKSIDLGKTSSDLLTKARNYTVQGTLYYLYYNWNKIIECSLAACDCYKTIGDIDNYVIMLCRVAEVNTLMGNKELGRDYLLRCQDLLDGINNNSKAYYYRVCLSNDSYELPSETIPQNIVEYLSLVSLDDADWLTVSGSYLRIHDSTSAKDSIS